MSKALTFFAAVALIGCGNPGRPLELERDGRPVDLSEANSTWDRGILTFEMIEDPVPGAVDDEIHHELRIDISEPYGLDDEILAFSGTAVIEGFECGATSVGFIASEGSDPSVVSAAGWRWAFPCHGIDLPVSQAVEGTLDIYEVTEGHIDGEIDVTVDPLVGSDPAAPARFHGRFDSR